MVKQPRATCPGSPVGATAGLGQVRHRLGSGVDLVAGGIGLGASAGGMRDRSPPTVSTVGFSAERETGHSGMTKYQIKDGARHSRRVSGAEKTTSGRNKSVWLLRLEIQCW